MNPVRRDELIRRLRKFGYKGPFPGPRHPFMKKGNHKLKIPNEHSNSKEIGSPLLDNILKQAGISREEWERLD